MLVTLENIKTLLESKVDLIQLSPIYKTHPRKWRLLRSLKIQLSNGQIVTIPEGFETDLASVPSWLWSVSKPYGDFMIGTLIHDFLYIKNIGTRKEADKELLIWSIVTNGNMIDNVVRFWAVRAFGQSWWDN